MGELQGNERPRHGRRAGGVEDVRREGRDQLAGVLPVYFFGIAHAEDGIIDDPQIGFAAHRGRRDLPANQARCCGCRGRGCHD